MTCGCAVAVFALTALPAAAQSVDEARAARDRAKAELIRAQDAFDRADEAYIKALGGAAAKPAESPRMPASGRPSTVTFSLSGTGSIDANLFDYRGRLMIDGRPGEWTQHASGAKYEVPAGARSVAYEVERNTSTDSTRPAWKKICEGSVPPKPATTVDIAIERNATRCAVK